MVKDQLEKQMLLAREAEVSENRSEALKLYAGVLKREPQNVDAQLGVAKIALELGHLSQAFQHFTSALILDQGRAEGFWGRGVVFFLMGHEAKALSDMRKAVSLDEPVSSLRIDIAATLNDFGYSAFAGEVLESLGVDYADDADFMAESIFVKLNRGEFEFEVLSGLVKRYQEMASEDPMCYIFEAVLRAYEGRDAEAKSLLALGLSEDSELIYRVKQINVLQGLLDG